MMILSKRALTQLRDDHRKTSRLRVAQSTSQGDRNPVSGVRRVVLTGALAAAPGNGGGVHVLCRGLQWDPATSKLVPNLKEYTVWSFDRNSTAAAYTYALIMWVEGRWEFLWLGCEPTDIVLLSGAGGGGL